MKLKSWKRWTGTLLTIIFCILFTTQEVEASSATVRFEVDQSEVYLGDTITVSLVVDTDTTLGDFEGNIVYDASVLEYVSGPVCIAGGDGMLRVSDFGASASWNARSYKMTFKVIGLGDCVFEVTGAPVAYGYDDLAPMSVSAASKTVSVTAPATASDNCDLEVLKISPGSLTPTFQSDITEYGTIVKQDTRRLIISAIAQDENATVKISGNQDFVPGSNYVTVKVRAESGQEKEYMIHVICEETKEDVSNKDDSESTYLHAERKDSEIVLKGLYLYTVAELTDGLEIPPDYIKSSILIDGIKVPVYQYKQEVEDDYLLMVLKNSFGQTGIYRYDRVEKTIQKYTGDRVIVQENTTSNELKYLADNKEYKSKLNRMNVYVMILAGLCFTLLLGNIVLFIKLKSKNQDF